MQQTATVEAGSAMAALLQRVEQAEQITITRSGKPVALLMPLPPAVTDTSAASALLRIRTRAGSLRSHPDTQSLKQERDADRP